MILSNSFFLAILGALGVLAVSLEPARIAGMKDFTRESLVHDPVHGYVPFVSVVPDGEVSERRLLDNPWLQRLRQIHQLQSSRLPTMKFALWRR